jgi:hypothetical protein
MHLITHPHKDHFYIVEYVAFMTGIFISLKKSSIEKALSIALQCAKLGVSQS